MKTFIRFRKSRPEVTTFENVPCGWWFRYNKEYFQKGDESKLLAMNEEGLIKEIKHDEPVIVLGTAEIGMLNEVRIFEDE